MRTIELTIYKFHELSEPAKERARDWFRENHETAWGDESLESIKRFCSEFGARLTDWSIGAYAPINYTVKTDNSNFRGRKLRDFSRDFMPTGYCLDCSLWMTFYDVFKRTGDAKAAFDAAVWQGFTDWKNDIEHQYSDEYAEEWIEANDCEFNENGGAV